MNKLDSNLFDLTEQLRKPTPELANPKVFDAIIDHIAKNRTIKLNELKKQNVNINDLVKFMQMLIISEVQDLNETEFYFDPEQVRQLSIAEQFQFWELAHTESEYTHLNDLFTIAFSKNRNSSVIKQATPHLTRAVLEELEKPHWLSSLRDLWVQQNFMRDQRIFENAYLLTCWLKFDNRDRDQLKAIKNPKRGYLPLSIDTTFDFDNRHQIMSDAIGLKSNQRISAFAYLCMLKFIQYDTDACNALIKAGVFHLSEIVLVKRIEDSRRLIN
jgi:hypothetical protein